MTDDSASPTDVWHHYDLDRLIRAARARLAGANRPATALAVYELVARLRREELRAGTPVADATPDSTTAATPATTTGAPIDPDTPSCSTPRQPRPLPPLPRAVGAGNGQCDGGGD